MESAADRGWSLVEDAELLTREWEGQIVLYHGGTGNTHLLDGQAAVIFNRLRQGAATEGQLAALLGEGTAGEDEPAGLRHTLGLLQRLDIVEPLPGEGCRASAG